MKMADVTTARTADQDADAQVPRFRLNNNSGAAATGAAGGERGGGRAGAGERGGGAEGGGAGAGAGGREAGAAAGQAELRANPGGFVTWLLRNRVSAQQARERRKQYLSELEGRVSQLDQRNAELKETLSTLQRENFMLRQVARNTAQAADAPPSH
ncbi:unnamed protein product [Closterium sp. NIES-65]|nr:unnamed protein product [Closterium sp. NIES-65]